MSLSPDSIEWINHLPTLPSTRHNTIVSRMAPQCRICGSNDVIEWEHGLKCFATLMKVVDFRDLVVSAQSYRPLRCPCCTNRRERAKSRTARAILAPPSPSRYRAPASRSAPVMAAKNSPTIVMPRRMVRPGFAHASWALAVSLHPRLPDMEADVCVSTVSIVCAPDGGLPDRARPDQVDLLRLF
jgi:hypothetical protein